MLLILSIFAIFALGEECTSFENLSDCRRIIDCFWSSKEGQCHKLADFARKGADDINPSIGLTFDSLSECKTYTRMDSCYLHLDCFWVAALGDCEDLSNWEPIYASRVACNTINQEDICWTVQECFWNKHVAECAHMAPYTNGDDGKTNLPSSNNPPTTSFQPTVISTSKATEAIIPSTTSRPSENPYHPRPCLGWGNADLCWKDMECFWDQRLDVCLDVTPVHINPFDVPPISKVGDMAAQQAYDLLSTTTSEVSAVILGIEDPMTLCETYDEPTCRADDDCVINEATLQCYGISDNDCGQLPSKYVCTANEDCHWSRSKRVCEGMCSSVDGEGRCDLEEDCLWNDSTQECLSVFSSCYKLSSPESCVQNEVCAWNQVENACISLFGPCTRHTEESFCTRAAQFNTHCEWGENPGQEEVFGCQDPFTTQPPIIECQAMTDMDTCLEATETESNMPCTWDGATQECSVFVLDCEQYETQSTCEDATFRDTRCFWDGECDIYEAGVIQKAHDPNSPTTLATSTIALIFIGALVGFILGICVIRLCKKNSNLREPLYFTP